MSSQQLLLGDKMKNTLFVVFSLSISTIVHAQNQYFIDLKLVLAKNVLQPGESQTLTLIANPSLKAGTPYIIQNATFPGVNGKPGVVKGVASVAVDVVNVQSGEHGEFSNMQILDPWNPLKSYSAGTPDGLGGLSIIEAAQFELLQIPDPPYGIPYQLQEPAVLWQATWTPTPGFAGVVEFTTDIPDIYQGLVPSIFAQTPLLQFWVRDRWTPVHHSSSFRVVPSPSCAAITATLALGATIRRKRRT
jgi:hypothetical protein